MSGVIWIAYTTRYRQGGVMLKRAATTMATEKRSEGADVVVTAVESKREFVERATRFRDRGLELDELHFIGHSGMYGPMFRTSAMPEQFSPHEWRALATAGVLPFSKSGRAYFHACRTARWFAPFFARTFAVPTYGYHWYTTFSQERERFRWIAPRRKNAPVYVIGCHGKRSHGLGASLAKYTGQAEAEPLKEFLPTPVEGDSSYDEVAALYAKVFDDIRVRKDEWRWLTRHLTRGTARPRVLDIGCGNGALLAQLAPQLTSGHGIDRSSGMLEHARLRTQSWSHLTFSEVTSPALPLADASVDVVLSLLSFRYLDWDPLMREIMRVLAPGGRILIVDMVTAPVTLREWPWLLRSKTRALLQQAAHPEFRRALRRLVQDPSWKTMLRYNPIRAEHEMRWFLESRFPGRKVELLNVGWRNRVLAFDSGPITPGTWIAPQSYP